MHSPRISSVVRCEEDGKRLDSEFPGVERYDLDQRLIVATTTRLGGVSKVPFDSLNLGFHPGDPRERVLENRDRVSTALGVSLHHLTCPRQAHGVHIRPVGLRERGRGARSLEDAIPETDGLVTRVPGVPLVVFGADCPGLVVFDPSGPAVGVAHSGWRGCVGNVASRLVRSLRHEFGADPEAMRALIAPGIGPCCFEVGPEVIRAGRKSWGAFDNHVTTTRTGGTMRRTVDLSGWVLAQLLALGLPIEGIRANRTCTRCRSDRYFSFRAASAMRKGTSEKRSSAITGSGVTIAMLLCD